MTEPEASNERQFQADQASDAVFLDITSEALGSALRAQSCLTSLLFPGTAAQCRMPILILVTALLTPWLSSLTDH